MDTRPRPAGFPDLMDPSRWNWKLSSEDAMDSALEPDLRLAAAKVTDGESARSDRSDRVRLTEFAGECLSIGDGTGSGSRAGTSSMAASPAASSAGSDGGKGGVGDGGWCARGSRSPPRRADKVGSRSLAAARR